MEENVFEYNNLGKRFNKMTSLLIIAVLCFLIFYFITSAWFGESEVATKVIVVGDISLEVETKLTVPDDILEPNKMYNDMPTTIKCAQDTDQAYIKVKLTTDYQVAGYHVIKPLLFVSDEDNANGKQSWIYSEIDDCYYYVGYASPEQTITFNTGIIVTNNINNIDKNQDVKFTLTVYAIQRYYSAYKDHDDWKNSAPQEWLERIVDYDVRDCSTCGGLVIGGNTPCPNCNPQGE